MFGALKFSYWIHELYEKNFLNKKKYVNNSQRGIEIFLWILTANFEEFQEALLFFSIYDVLKMNGHITNFFENVRICILYS